MRLPKAFSSQSRLKPGTTSDKVIDVTDLPQNIAVRGAQVELLGSHVSADELARRAGTIAYEIFTGLGSRFARVYSGNESL